MVKGARVDKACVDFSVLSDTVFPQLKENLNKGYEYYG